MEKTYEVCYENNYGTVTNCLDNDVSWTSDEMVVCEGSLEKCINYLKTQMIDAALKFLNLDYNVDISKSICSWGMIVTIEVSERCNEEFRVYESAYRLYY